MLPPTWIEIDQDTYELPTCLAGQLILSRGHAADYATLARFHYRPSRPATWAQVWTIRHLPGRHSPPSPIALAVLSHPTLACHIRDRALDLGSLSISERHRFINTHLRTISRVIVHPTYRSLGLATALVQCLLHHTPTRFTESLATMARAHHFFDAAGMERHEPEDDDSPVYYLFDSLGVPCPPCQPSSPTPSLPSCFSPGGS